MRFCTFRSSLALLAVLSSLIVARGARANGLELLPGGTQSVSRGGAVAARPENAMALEQNPAGMALLSGDQLLLNVDVPVHDMCADLYGYYGWGIYQAESSEFGDPLGNKYATDPLPKVCNTAQVFGIPHMAWAGKITEDLAIGAGFVAPTLVTGMQFGGSDGTIQDGPNARPTPTRYQLIRQTAKFGAAPSLGVGYRVLPQLQIGATLMVAMLNGDSRAIQNATAGTQPSTDWLVDVNAHDYFIPTVTMSANAQPVRGLNVMASFRWADDFDGSGSATYTTRTYFHPDATSGPLPFKNDPIKLSRIVLKLPWAATLAARYGYLLPPRSDQQGKGLGDPLDTELWDVEVDGTYNFNKRASDSFATASGNVTVISRAVGGGGDANSQNIDEKVTANRHLRDSIALRVGGSYSVLPRKFAVEAGAFYENRGVDPAYAGIDSFAFQRVGFGLGVLARFGSWDLMGGYGHIFSETLEVAPPDHQVVQMHKKGDPTTGFDQRVGVNFDNNDPKEGRVLRDPSAPSIAKADAVARLQQSTPNQNAADLARVINAGKYTAAFNIISVGAVYHW